VLWWMMPASIPACLGYLPVWALGPRGGRNLEGLALVSPIKLKEKLS
jgi:hypothetical protein